MMSDKNIFDWDDPIPPDEGPARLSPWMFGRHDDGTVEAYFGDTLVFVETSLERAVTRAQEVDRENGRIK